MILHLERDPNTNFIKAWKPDDIIVALRDLPVQLSQSNGKHPVHWDNLINLPNELPANWGVIDGGVP